MLTPVFREEGEESGEEVWQTLCVMEDAVLRELICFFLSPAHWISHRPLH